MYFFCVNKEKKRKRNLFCHEQKAQRFQTQTRSSRFSSLPTHVFSPPGFVSRVRENDISRFLDVIGIFLDVHCVLSSLASDLRGWKKLSNKDEGSLLLHQMVFIEIKTWEKLVNWWKSLSALSFCCLKKLHSSRETEW